MTDLTAALTQAQTVDEKLAVMQGFLLAQGRAWKVITLGRNLTILAQLCQQVRAELQGKEPLKTCRSKKESSGRGRKS